MIGTGEVCLAYFSLSSYGNQEGETASGRLEVRPEGRLEVRPKVKPEVRIEVRPGKPCGMTY